MVNKIEELESILKDLSKRKEKYESISDQATKVIDELEGKIMYAVRNSQNLPRTADISVIIQTFSQLLKTKLDAEDSITRALEKRYDLVNKYQNPNETTDPNAISASAVDELIKRFNNRQNSAETAAE
jgi:DNA-directed RNA polymerase subunit H (RpoH/RPB5)